MYITNYGRLLKSDTAKFVYTATTYSTGGSNSTSASGWCYEGIHNIHNKALNITGANIVMGQWNAGFCSYALKVTNTPQTVNLVKQPKLEYRLPKLFMKVIDAFYANSTDLMQECCKEYLLHHLGLSNYCKLELAKKDDTIQTLQADLANKNDTIQTLQSAVVPAWVFALVSALVFALVSALVSTLVSTLVDTKASR